MNLLKSKLWSYLELVKDVALLEVYPSRYFIEIKHRYNRLYMKCKKAKKNTLPGDKPVPVKTHLRDAIIMPDMVGSNVAVHNGKTFNIVEVKFDMIGRYLGEFSLTYKHTKHGKAGVGATKGSAHTALK